MEEIIRQIDYLKNMYDLLALCIEVLLKLKPDYDYKSDDFCRYKDEVGVLLTEYERNCREFCKSNAIKKMRRPLKRYLGKIRGNENVNFDKIYALILGIDDRIPPVVADSFSEQADIKEYTALNQQYKDQIRIIPKKITGFLGEPLKEGIFRKQRNTGESDLEEVLKNYHVVQANIDRETISLYRVSKNSELYDHFVNQEKISIGMFSVTDSDLEKLFEVPCENGKFEVLEMYEEMKPVMLEKYQQIFKELHGKQINFLLFPEMLMTQSLLQEVKELEKKSGAAHISVNGTIWKECRNWAVVTDLCGEEIAVYYKKKPFEYKKNGKKYWEHLIPSEGNSEYVFLEIEEFGRISVAICKDLLDPRVIRVHRRLFTNILLIPAYSPSLDLQSEARSLSEQVGCIVIFANACSARKGHEDVGFICVPAKKNNDRTSKIKKYHEKDCNIKDEQRCGGKFCLIYLNQFETDSDEMLSFKIEMKDNL